MVEEGETPNNLSSHSNEKMASPLEKGIQLSRYIFVSESDGKPQNQLVSDSWCLCPQLSIKYKSVCSWIIQIVFERNGWIMARHDKCFKRPRPDLHVYRLLRFRQVLCSLEGGVPFGSYGTRFPAGLRLTMCSEFSENHLDLQRNWV